MTAIETFLRRMDKANSEKNPFPADRVINSIDFLRQLGREVDDLVKGPIVLSDMYDAAQKELNRQSTEAMGVFDRKGDQTN